MELVQQLPFMQKFEIIRQFLFTLKEYASHEENHTNYDDEMIEQNETFSNECEIYELNLNNQKLITSGSEVNYDKTPKQQERSFIQNPDFSSISKDIKHGPLKKKSIPIEEMNSARLTDGSEDTYTLRHLTKKPKRSTYLSNKKKPQIPKPVGVATVEKVQPVRPSDIIQFEQNKKMIDELCYDNQTLHRNLQDAMKAIEILKDHIKELKSQCNQNLQDQMIILKNKLDIKEQELLRKDRKVTHLQEKIQELNAQFQKYLNEIDLDTAEQDKFITSIIVENTLLRKLLGITFTEEQLKIVEENLDKTELDFFDNFCISRKDLEQKAILEYEKVLAERKGNMESQFVDWHVQYMKEQQDQMMIQQRDFEKNRQIQKIQPSENDYVNYDEETEPIPKKKTLSKEEKDKIKADLLKPINITNFPAPKKNQLQEIPPQENSQAEKIFFEEKQEIEPQDKQKTEQEDQIKCKQLEILSSGPKSKSKLSLQIDLIEKTVNNSQDVQVEFGLDDFQDNDYLDEEEQEGENNKNSNEYLKIMRTGLESLKQPVPEPPKQQQQIEKKPNQKAIMDSLEDGWQKLLNSKKVKEQQKKQDSILMTYFEDEEHNDQPNPYMFSNSKTILYDQDEYYDDEDEELYEEQNTMIGQLSKANKFQQLQFQNQASR